MHTTNNAATNVARYDIWYPLTKPIGADPPLWLDCPYSVTWITLCTIPDSKVHGANIELIWGRQDPGWPHVGPVNFAIWDIYLVHALKSNMLQRYGGRKTSGFSWWRHVTGPNVMGVHRWFPSQRPVTRSFDVFFDLRLNKRFSKQSRRRWFETPSRSLWHHCNIAIDSSAHRDYALWSWTHSPSDDMAT